LEEAEQRVLYSDNKKWECGMGKVLPAEEVSSEDEYEKVMK
jgi:hypothetical protein